MSNPVEKQIVIETSQILIQNSIFIAILKTSDLPEYFLIDVMADMEFNRSIK